MARKQYIDLSNSIEAWRQKNNITSDYIGDLDDLNLSTPYDQTIVRAINHLDDRVLSEGETRSLFTVVHTGPTNLSSLTYEPSTGTFYYNTVDLQPFHIPSLDASKITSGQFNPDRIPPLDASKIASGVLNLNRIPNLPASKITSGQFSPNRIPGLDASKVVSGIFDLARIPDIPITKLTLGSGGETISKSVLPSDIVYTGNFQTITGEKIFSGNLRMASTIKADFHLTRDIGEPQLKFKDVYANRFIGTATQSLYADLAEKYLADDVYEYGTIVAIGGEKEITIASEENAHSIMGVVSKDPGFIMNSDLEDGTLVALKGRVPVRVESQVRKGDRLVISSTPGHAKSDNTSSEYIGISLQDGSGIVEAYVK